MVLQPEVVWVWVRYQTRDTKRWRHYSEPLSSIESAKRFAATLLSEYGDAAAVEVIVERRTREVVHEEKRA